MSFRLNDIKGKPIRPVKPSAFLAGKWLNRQPRKCPVIHSRFRSATMPGFTLNNPTADEIDFSQSPYVRYAIWQKEIGANGSPHLQGYVEFNKNVSFKATIAIFGNGAHLEERRGTRDEAREYCRKADTRTAGPWEYGTWISGSGARNDLEQLKEYLDAGMTEEQIYDKDFAIWGRYCKLIERARMLKWKDHDFRTSFHVLVGDAGTGKSLTARNACGEILALADSGPHMVPVKGGYVNFADRAVYATSNKDVLDWYPDAMVQEQQALCRRIESKTTFRWVENGDVRTVKTTREFYQVIPGMDSPVPAPTIVEVPERPLLELAAAANEVLTAPEAPCPKRSRFSR